MLQTKNIRHNDHYSIKNNENLIILNSSLNLYETNWQKSMAYLSMCSDQTKSTRILYYMEFDEKKK